MSSRRHSVMNLFRTEEDLSRFYVEPPKDHMDPKAVKKVPRYIQTSEDVYKCFRAYYGPRSGTYPVIVVLKYLEYKEHKGRLSGDDTVNGVPTSVKHKLEVLEHMFPRHAETFAIVRQARGMNRSRVITNMVWPPKWAWDPNNKVVVPALPPPPPVPPPQPSLAMRQAEAALETASETESSRRRRSNMRPTTYYDASSTVDGDGRVLTPSEILRLESERSASHLSLASFSGMPNVPPTADGTPAQSRQPSSTAPSTIESTDSSGLHTSIDTKIKKRGSRFFSFFGGGRSRSESNLAALASDPFGSTGPQLAPPSTTNLGRVRTPSTPLSSRTAGPPSPGSSSLRVPASGPLSPLTPPGTDKRASWVPATSSPLAKSRFTPAMPTPTPTMPSIADARSRTTSIGSTATRRRAPPPGAPRQDQLGMITPTRSVTEPARPRSALPTVEQGGSPRDSVLFSKNHARRESLVFTSEPGRPRESVVYTFVDPLPGDEDYGLPRVAQATDLNFETPSSAEDPPPAPIPMSREAAFVRDRYAAANAVAQASRAQHVSGPPQPAGGDVFGQPNGTTAGRQGRLRQSVAPQTISPQQGRIRMSTGPQALDGTPSPSPTQPLYASRRTPTGRPLHTKASSLSATSVKSETEWSFLMHNQFMPQNSTDEPPSPTSTARLAYEESSQGHGHRRSNTATGSDFTIPPVPPLPSSLAWQSPPAPPPPVPPIPELERNERVASATPTPTPLDIPSSLPVTPDSPSSPGSPLQLPNQLAHQRKPRPVLHIDIPVKTTAAPIILPSVPSAGSSRTVTAVQKPYSEGDVDRTAVEHPADANAGYADVLLYSRVGDYPRA
ncbi:uncharacterized protein LOC62_05G007541 [Vanrija pseudolonga]|uniref:Uncharacterized protein n=1 Tax=Vanrija pseudolonga TaxID=143232 RepID=A0AAF0YFH6_9TREE|nr:hypothetical protein LOC62_05G007541 [Vanrija pseudolonga]